MKVIQLILEDGKGKHIHLSQRKAKVASLQEEIEHGEMNAPHTFVARCRACM